jgi:hypothetical protein
MTSFEKRLQELGITIDDLSIRLKKEVAQFYKIKEAVEEMGENEPQSENYQIAYEELQKADIELVHKINKYEKNKDGYKERAIKMQEARRGSVNREYESHRNVNTQRLQEPSKPKIEQKVEEKIVDEQPIKTKKNDTAFWVLAGIVGVITLGGVIMNKNK